MPISASNDYWGHTRYVKSPIYDWFWIILSPAWAIALGWVISNSLLQDTVRIFDATDTGAFFFYMSLTQAHLFITVFRTHVNNKVFDQFYWRFTLVPMALLALAILNHWVFAALFVTMVFWDVYHSAMQVFGLGRIYDRKMGNDPNIGRWPDYLLSIMIYAGPVIGGVLLLSHLNAFSEFSTLAPLQLFDLTLRSDYLVQIPGFISPYLPAIQQSMLVIGLAILLVYMYAILRLRKVGYRLPPAKFAMFLTTLVACVFAWGYNSFALGYLIANVFHAVQYFSLVWAMEDKYIGKVFGLSVPIRIGGFILVPLSLGLLSVSFDSHAARALLVVCALMHFWWDGFIWSVRADDGIPEHGSLP